MTTFPIDDEESALIAQPWAPTAADYTRPFTDRPALPRTNTPTVSYALLVIIGVLFALQMLSQYLLGVDVLEYWGAKFLPFVADNQWWRLITPAFLHGSVMHVVFNGYALYALGPALERYYGHGRFLALFLLSAYAGNALSLLMTPNPSLGASTSIYGLFAAQVVFMLGNRRFFGGANWRQLQGVVLVLVLNFAISLAPGIDLWGHVGGLLGGAAFAWLGGPLLDVEGSPSNWRIVDARSATRVWVAAGAVIAAATLLALVAVLRYNGGL